VKKNVASQSIGAEMITAADGTAFTGTVSVLVTVDNGTQTAGGGTAPAHEGNGYHSYTPTQAETNGDHIAFTFNGTGAIPATIQVYTNFPQTQDHTTPIDNIDTIVDLIKVDTTSILDDTSTSGVIVATNNDKTGYTASTVTDKSGYSISGTKTTLDALNDIAATSIVSAGAITTNLGAVSNVTTVATTTTNTDMRGTDNALLAASYTAPPTAASISTAVWSETVRVLTAGTNIALAKGIGVTGFNDITASSVLAAGNIDGYTLEESQKLVLAASAGTLSGAATTTITINAVDGSKARLTATVDGDGNRSAVIKDVTG